jgi:hypothetical protein
MAIDMNESRLTLVQQLSAFLAGSLDVQYQPLDHDYQRYALISSELSRFGYQALGRADKGVVLRYLEGKPGGQVLPFVPHLAPGQDSHLPHEPWHLVQQRQGRVKPTLDVGGTPATTTRTWSTRRMCDGC